jgi:guanylate kinase
MKQANRDGMLFCLIGPTGSGKTTLAQSLMKEFGATVRSSVSATTRPRRDNEVEGVHYHFMTVDQFQAKIAENAFFEWEEVHGNWYGTLKKTVEDSIAEGVDLILDIDIRGALNFRRAYPAHTVTTFLVAPNYEVLLQRVRGRGAMNEEELKKRVATARFEYDKVLKTGASGDIDYFVENDKYEDTYLRITSILRAERSRTVRLDKGWLASKCTL